MKKRTRLVINIILILIVVTSIFLNGYVYAAASSTAAPDPKGFTGDTSISTSGISKMGNQIITVISTVASICSVIVLVVLGIKYMMGSAEEKAEYKKTLLPYVIGAVLVFAASVIAGVIFNFANSFTGT